MFSSGKMSKERERERARVRRQGQLREIIKKMKKNEYFIEISCKIEELMWVSYISDNVK